MSEGRDASGRSSARPSNSPSGSGPKSKLADESPGVPGFATWRGVYWFVFGCFALFVIALTIFSRVYA